jgi:hypothetical protein
MFRTIDPNVDVLRVDRVQGKRLIPMGGWLDFARVAGGRTG